jgi:hypothetical protein
MCAPSRSPQTAVSTSTSTRRPVTPEPADSPNVTMAISTNPSGQIVSMIACTPVRIA